ncbi:TolC family protein [Paucihalobacter ruber]|uniref:TolC family protein n=1 Tax=Paucihalobacter ruber TaxID=2567861 RepID=A0A506PRE9_9FLAO|nr:TolC family protein [Paucihalobacter ruber]TPV35832.1 TolC family protein [Paucihalobacter ruber]
MRNTIVIIIAFVFVSGFAQEKKWTLKECIEYAYKNNISVEQSLLDVDQSNVDKTQAIANFLPSLNANASFNINTGANINPATNQFENTVFRSASGGANSGLNLFSGLQNWRNLQRAKLNITAARYRLDKMKDDISLLIANSFLSILSNKEQLKVIQGQFEVTQENIKNTKELVDGGVLPEGDLLEILATSASQEQQMIAAENNLIISKIGLAQLLQLRNYETFDIADENFELISEAILEEKPASIFEKAKDELNDVKIASANLEIAEKDLQLAKGNYFPTVTAFMGYNARWASTQRNPFTGEQISFADQLWLFDGTAIGFQLNIPIFNRLNVRSNVQRNKINVERSRLQLEQVSLDLESNVYQAYNDAKNSKKFYQAAVKTAEARRLAFEYAKERYDVGLSNAFDYNQSRIAYENAQSDIVRTKFNYIFSLKVLEFYFGVDLAGLY